MSRADARMRRAVSRGRRDAEDVLSKIRDPARLRHLLPSLGRSSRAALSKAVADGRAGRTSPAATAAWVGHHIGMLDALHSHGLPRSSGSRSRSGSRKKSARSGRRRASHGSWSAVRGELYRRRPLASLSRPKKRRRRA